MSGPAFPPSNSQDTWSRNATSVFITEFKNHKCLWNMKCPQYRDKELRAEAFKSIINAMETVHVKTDENSIRKKINTIRSQFRREYKLYLKRKTDSYRPTLWCFNELQFLRNDQEPEISSLSPEESGSIALSWKYKTDEESSSSNVSTPAVVQQPYQSMNLPPQIPGPLFCLPILVENVKKEVKEVEVPEDKEEDDFTSDYLDLPTFDFSPKMTSIKTILSRAKPAVIGMIHVKALPGTPCSSLSVEEIVSEAEEEAKIYCEAGVDSVMVENMWDIPYVQSKEMGPEVVAVMTRVCRAVREIMPHSCPCGVQVLAGGGEQALAVSLAADLQFIRAESFVFGHVADEGWMDACAGKLMRYRKQIGATEVSVLTDIKKKHSAHAVTKDINVSDTAKAAEFFQSDGVILTGSSTGEAASPSELIDVRKNVKIPVLIGSGVTIDNVEDFKSAHGLIIGSHFKEDGRWSGKLSFQKVKNFMSKMQAF